MTDDTPYEKIPTWASPSDLNQIHVGDQEIRWWEPQNLPWQIIRELRRRSNQINVGQNANTDVCINFKDNYDKYRGPMTPWVRVFSNGTGNVKIPSTTPSKFLYKNNKMDIYDGFILEGEKDFYKGYGYKQYNTSVIQDNAIIGYQANGKPHYIDNRYRNNLSYNAPINCSNGDVKFPQLNFSPAAIPPPGISSINVKTNKDMMSTGTINWKCYGLAQLEYMMPFFLTPKINVFIEFGWNLFDIKSLLSLKIDECYELIKEPQKAIARYNQSFGNYGMITGIIHKYNFETKNGFTYDCVTEVYSRQAMWAGWRSDSYIQTKSEKAEFYASPSTEFVNLKEFFRHYLNFTKNIVSDRKNFIEWLINNKENIRFEKQKEVDFDKNAIQNLLTKNEKNTSNNSDELVKKFKSMVNNSTKYNSYFVENTGESNKKYIKFEKFYKGKPESRIFMGRDVNIYKKYKRPKVDNTYAWADDPEKNPLVQGAIEYGTFSDVRKQYNVTIPERLEPNIFKPPSDDRKIVSDADKIDFDYEETPNDEVWYQLDFVFEIINLFCSTETNDSNYIDISDVIINAHPNLISCDKNVLIPNSIAPKINVGKFFPDKDFGYFNLERVGGGSGGLTLFEKKLILKKPDIKSAGYLSWDEYKDPENIFTKYSLIWYWTTFRNEVEAGLKSEEKKIINKNKNPDCVETDDENQPLWKAAFKAKSAFKSLDYVRDNLDVLINKLHYDIEKENGNNIFGKAAFPCFIKNQSKKLEKYQPHYYGYLKHIYISKSILQSIGEDESLKTLEQIVKKILNTVNESVGDFWKLDVILNSNGGIKIIDKSLTLPKESEIYMFDVASTSNVIKQISFGATLTNEQSNQVLFGSGNNSETYASLIKNITNDPSLTKQEKINKITQTGNSLPSIVFEDRLDSEAMKEFTKESTNVLQNQNVSIDQIPTGPLEDENIEIRSLQKYGKQSDVLIMTLRSLSPGEDPVNPKNIPIKNFVYLNLPPSLKPKLLQMLDDGDTSYNDAKYSGPADNFTLTMTFDGIMGFRMFQHFSISNLPKPYVPGNVIFMVTEVEHQITSGKWETVVTAMLKSAPDKNYKFIPI